MQSVEDPGEGQGGKSLVEADGKFGSKQHTPAPYEKLMIRH